MEQSIVNFLRIIRIQFLIFSFFYYHPKPLCAIRATSLWSIIRFMVNLRSLVASFTKTLLNDWLTTVDVSGDILRVRTTFVDNVHARSMVGNNLSCNEFPSEPALDDQQPLDPSTFRAPTVSPWSPLVTFPKIIRTNYTNTVGVSRPTLFWLDNRGQCLSRISAGNNPSLLQFLFDNTFLEYNTYIVKLGLEKCPH